MKGGRGGGRKGGMEEEIKVGREEEGEEYWKERKNKEMRNEKVCIKEKRENCHKK